MFVDNLVHIIYDSSKTMSHFIKKIHTRDFDNSSTIDDPSNETAIWINQNLRSSNFFKYIFVVTSGTTMISHLAVWSLQSFNALLTLLSSTYNY